MTIRTMVTYQNAAVIHINLLDGAFATIVHDSIMGGYGLDKLQGIIERNLTPGSYYINLQTEGTKFGDFQFVLADQNDSGYPIGSITTLINQTQSQSTLRFSKSEGNSPATTNSANLVDLQGRKTRASLQNNTTQGIYIKALGTRRLLNSHKILLTN